MIRPVLAHHLQYKKRPLLPNRALTEIFNEFSDSQIVIGYWANGVSFPLRKIPYVIPNRTV